MQVGSDPEGGYLVPVELDGTIGQYLENENPMRRLARVVNTSSDVFELPFNVGQSASGWVGENESRTTTQPSRSCDDRIGP